VAEKFAGSDALEGLVTKACFYGCEQNTVQPSEFFFQGLRLRYFRELHAIEQGVALHHLCHVRGYVAQDTHDVDELIHVRVTREKRETGCNLS